METQKQDLGQELAACKVKTFDTTEMIILSAIKSGEVTIDKIVEATKIKESVVVNIINSLLDSYHIVVNTSTNEYEYELKNPSTKKYSLGGNMILPVSTFVDKSGVRWVTRGTWHQIDEDTDIIADIEWFDDTDKQTQMQSIMKSIKEKKSKKTSKQENTANVPEEIATKLKQWLPITEHLKIQIVKGGETTSICSISLIIDTDGGYRFPWHTMSLMNLSNEFIISSINNETFNKAIELRDLVINIKEKLCIFSKVTNNEITWGDIRKVKTDGFKLTRFSHDVHSGTDKTIEILRFANVDEIMNHIINNYNYTTDLINKINSSVNE